MGIVCIDLTYCTAMKFVIVILLISALTGSLEAGPIQKTDNKDDSLDNYIKAILEMLKAGMPTGFPELGIPVLDPFAVPHFDIPHISESGVEADITLDNLMVKNLATFETRNIHVDILDLNMQIELFVPLLRADGVYSLVVRFSDYSRYMATEMRTLKLPDWIYLQILELLSTPMDICKSLNWS